MKEKTATTYQALDEYFTSTGGIEMIVEAMDRMIWQYVLDRMNSGDDCHLEAEDVYWIHLFIKASRESTTKTVKL